MELIIVGLIALAAGVLIGMALRRQRPIGDLRVDHSDPDGGPYLFLELDTDVSAIMRKKHVMLRVKVADFIPHE